MYRAWFTDMFKCELSPTNRRYIDSLMTWIEFIQHLLLLFGLSTAVGLSSLNVLDTLYHSVIHSLFNSSLDDLLFTHAIQTPNLLFGESALPFAHFHLTNGVFCFCFSGKDRPVMEWPTRLKIALGSAKGLAYLHEDCEFLLFIATHKIQIWWSVIW